MIHYPGKNPAGTHDDEIEVLAIGVQSLSQGMIGEVAPDNLHEYLGPEIGKLEFRRGAP